MFKRLSLIALVFLILLTGCSKNNTQTETDTNVDVPETQEHDTVENIEEVPSSDEYDPNAILFVADSESDDREVLYCYNYKGELLEEADSTPRFYSANGLAVAAAPNGNVGFVDEEGLFVIEPVYYDAMPFSEDGLALVNMQIEGADNSYYGFINEKGEEVIPCKYDSLTPFNDNGCALAIIGNAFPFHDENTVYQVIEKSGKVILENKGGVLILTENCIIKHGENANTYHDFEGNVMYTLEHDDIGTIDYQQKHDGVYLSEYIVGKNSQVTETVVYTFNDGKMVKAWKESFTYNEGEKICDYFEHGNFSAEKVMSANTGSGYVWKFDDRINIPAEYEDFEINGNYIFLFKYKDSGLLDKTTDVFDMEKGEIILSAPYWIIDRGYMIDGYFEISTQSSRSSEGWCVGIIDVDGNVIVEPTYETVTPFTYEAIISQAY